MKKKKQTIKEPYKKYVERQLLNLKRLMFLHEYTHSISWGCSKEKECGAHIDTNSTYLKFHLCIHKNAHELYENGDKYACMNLLVHEMCHVLTEPLYLFSIGAATNMTQPMLEEIRERQTQRIANVVMALLDKQNKV